MDDSKLEVEKFKIKQMLKGLADCRGNGTSLITIMIPSGGDLNGMKRTLVEEYGTATNIKSRVNRLSVLGAITSAQHKLKGFNQLPENGLVLFCGEPFSGKRVSMCFEPFKKLSHKMYMCDSRFHTEPLEELLEDSERFGFIIIDGNGALFGTLNGNEKQTLFHYKVDLPKKHKKGGQSSARFGRLAQEARQLYISKVAEMSVKYFIEDNLVNVKGIIVAGSAEMKDKLTQFKDLDCRVKEAIISVITISYGGQSGFDEAINSSEGVLSDLKIMEEKKELQKFFTLIAEETGTFCYGPKNTMQALDIGAIENLLVDEELKFLRVTVKTDDNLVIEFCLPDELDEVKQKYGDSQTEITTEPLIDWIVENYIQFGATLHIVSDASPEGTQFCRGFGGIGGTLRWKVDLDPFDDAYYSEYSDDDSDFI